MAKRRRDNTIIRHNKRPLQVENSPDKHKKVKNVEYWHHETVTRQQRAAEMAAMYIHLLNIKK